jgi:hypothetical protein
VVFRLFSWLKNLLVPGAGFGDFLLDSPGFQIFFEGEGEGGNT